MQNSRARLLTDLKKGQTTNLESMIEEDEEVAWSENEYHDFSCIHVTFFKYYFIGEKMWYRHVLSRVAWR